MSPTSLTRGGRPLEGRDLRLAQRLRRRRALAILIAVLLGGSIGLLLRFL